MKSWFIAAAILSMPMSGAPGGPQTSADIRQLTSDPADRAMIEDVAQIDAETVSIAKLDAILAKLPRPTPLRGVVQTMRAYVLMKANAEAQAIVAIEEAMRLLPDDSQSKLLASTIFLFSGAETRAADLWLQVSRTAPEAARTADAYVMDALIGRLVERGDMARADRVRARMAEIGFNHETAPERSSAALAQVKEALRVGDATRAAAHVTAIGDPDDLAQLYLDRRAAALWPRIAE